MKTWKTEQGVINFNSLEPISLPEDFTFEHVIEIETVLPFLNQNYIETNSDFYLEYTLDHLNWYFNNAVFDFITIKHEGDIIGTISGKFETIYLIGKKENAYEINFLCINPLFRKKKILNFLIAEIGRLALLKNITMGIYMSKDKHSKPLCEISYFVYYANLEYVCHEMKYSLNLPFFDFLKKYYINQYQLENFESKFLTIKKNIEVSSFIIHKLNRKYNEFYKLAPIFDKFNFDSKVITTFTLFLSSKISGFISFYNLNLVQKTSGKKIKQAYIMYYWYDESVISDEVLFKSVFNKLDTDLIITTNIGNLANEELRNSIKINNKCDNMYYYVYNKKVEEVITPSDIGLFIP